MSEGAAQARSKPQLPGFVAGTATIFRMQIRRLVRGRRLRLAIAATALIVLAVGAAQYAGAPSSEGLDPGYAAERATAAMGEGLRWGFFNLLVFFLPFLFCSAAIGEEIEARTFSYLTTRPIGRVSIVLGKWLAGVAMSLALLTVAVLLLHVAAYATEPTAMIGSFGETLRALVGVLMLAVAYCAICTCFGALAPDAPGVLSALYLAILEFGLSFMPSYFRCASLNYSAQQLAGLEKAGFMVDTAPDISAPIAGAVLVLASLLFMVFATLTVQLSEYRFSKG